MRFAPVYYIFDMGQNMVGWCRLTVAGPRGTTVTLRHAERLRPNGMLYMDNLRSAEATDTYILKGVERRSTSRALLTTASAMWR